MQTFIVLTRCVFTDIIRVMSIQLAIKSAGSASKLAKLLGAPHPSTVTNWVIRGVPVEQCPAIEIVTGVRCEDLCPGVTWNRDGDGKPFSYTIPIKPALESVVNQTMTVCKTPKLGATS